MLRETYCDRHPVALSLSAVRAAGKGRPHRDITMIARAFIRQNPLEVWGTGEQIRNWTYIDDVVDGTILAAERINEGTAVNLGTMERIRVADAAAMILHQIGVEVPLSF